MRKCTVEQAPRPPQAQSSKPGGNHPSKGGHCAGSAQMSRSWLQQSGTRAPQLNSTAERGARPPRGGFRRPRGKPTRCEARPPLPNRHARPELVAGAGPTTRGTGALPGLGARVNEKAARGRPSRKVRSSRALRRADVRTRPRPSPSPARKQWWVRGSLRCRGRPCSAWRNRASSWCQPAFRRNRRRQ